MTSTSELRAARDTRGIAEPVRTDLRDTRARFDSAATAVADGDFVAIAGTAHSLKGSSANLAARRVASLCGELEAAAADAGLADQVLRRRDGDFERVLHALHDAFHFGEG